VRVVETDGQDL